MENLSENKLFPKEKMREAFEKINQLVLYLKLEIRPYRGGENDGIIWKRNAVRILGRWREVTPIVEHRLEKNAERVKIIQELMELRKRMFLLCRLAGFAYPRMVITGINAPGYTDRNPLDEICRWSEINNNLEYAKEYLKRPLSKFNVKAARAVDYLKVYNELTSTDFAPAIQVEPVSIEKKNGCTFVDFNGLDENRLKHEEESFAISREYLVKTQQAIAEEKLAKAQKEKEEQKALEAKKKEETKSKKVSSAQKTATSQKSKNSKDIAIIAKVDQTKNKKVLRDSKNTESDNVALDTPTKQSVVSPNTNIAVEASSSSQTKEEELDDQVVAFLETEGEMTRDHRPRRSAWYQAMSHMWNELDDSTSARRVKNAANADSLQSTSLGPQNTVNTERLVSTINPNLPKQALSALKTEKNQKKASKNMKTGPSTGGQKDKINSAGKKIVTCNPESNDGIRCPECDKVFDKQRALMGHLRMHKSGIVTFKEEEEEDETVSLTQPKDQMVTRLSVRNKN